MTNLHTQKPFRKMMIMEEAGGMGRREEAGGAQALPVQGSPVQLLVLGGGAGQRK